MNRQNIVGPQIARLRYQRSWSQAKLAVELNLKGLEVEREFVAQIEGQTHCVKDRYLPYFAAALGVQISDLFPKLPPNQTVHQSMTILLRERRNGHVAPIVTGALQLVGNGDGK